MEQKHREACDACHDRKIQCPSKGPGACSNCQTTGRICVFSPREEMGRPRKAGKRKERDGPHTRQKSKASTEASWGQHGADIEGWSIQQQQQQPQQEQAQQQQHHQHNILNGNENHRLAQMTDCHGHPVFPCGTFESFLYVPSCEDRSSLTHGFQ